MNSQIVWTKRLMLYCLSLLIFSIFLSCKDQSTITKKDIEPPQYAIVIHGGAGYIPKSTSAEHKEAYLLGLTTALNIGENILKNGGSSLDAVEETIKNMEDNPIFNSGKGAVFNHEGSNELDASIMFGKDQNGGAVGGVSTIKNPITAARAVMEKSDHVLLTGKGADEFAKTQNLDIVAPEYFYTQNSWNSLQRVLKKEKEKELIKEKHGTVGCVALDRNGNIAAGTSTGGMTNKRYNRIGDSPILGAGTYADNNTCGVSCTGHGEYFIRYTIARDMAAMMEYGQTSLEQAGQYLVMEKLVDKGGAGGLIAIDKNGNIIMPFNTESMLRAYAKPGEKQVLIH